MKRDLGTEIGLIYGAYKLLWRDLAPPGDLDAIHHDLRAIFYDLQSQIERKASHEWTYENPLQWITAEAAWVARDDKLKLGQTLRLLKPNQEAVKFVRKLWHQEGEQDLLYTSFVDLLIPYVSSQDIERTPLDDLFRLHEELTGDAYEDAIITTTQDEITIVHKIGSYAFIDFSQT